MGPCPTTLWASASVLRPTGPPLLPAAAPRPPGFPLTDASVGRQFAVTTGHDVEGMDWGPLAAMDALVILMGGANLPAIAQRLMQHGRPPGTPVRREDGLAGGAARLPRGARGSRFDPVTMRRPAPVAHARCLFLAADQAGRSLARARAGWGQVAVVRAAGAPDQRVWRSSLGRVAADTAGEKLSPCIVVVGPVAGLQWGGAAIATSDADATPQITGGS
jgi:hypothetical protein